MSSDPFKSFGVKDPRNKFSVWYRSLSGAAIIGAITSIGGALVIFSAATLLSDPTQVTSSNTSLLLLAELALFAFGVSNLWFTVSLMGFGFRAAQFAKARGVQLRFAPGWAIGGWFVPVASLIIPYLVLRDVAGLGSQDAATRKRGILWFWIWWILLSNITSLALQLVISNSQADQFAGWKLFAGALAFFIVPFMMGRKTFSDINAELKALIV